MQGGKSHPKPQIKHQIMHYISAEAPPMLGPFREPGTQRKLRPKGK